MMFSIIIPTFKRKDLLEVGLTSLDKQNIPWSYEIIVLNEHPEDGSKEICARHKNIRYIVTRPNESEKDIKWRCCTIAINIGIKLAKGKNIILTSPEIYHPNPNNIKNIIEPLLINKKLMTFTRGFDDSGGRILKILRNKEAFPPLVLKQNGLKELHTQYPFFMGMNKQEVIDIGGYDEDFQYGYCFDDTNFVRRMWVNGNNYLEVPGEIVHLYHSRARFNLPETRNLWLKNEKLYNERSSKAICNEGREWGVFNG